MIADMPRLPIFQAGERPDAENIAVLTQDPGGFANVLGGVDMAMPGDGVQLKVTLKQPIAVADGDHFAIREGGKTVGSGVVTRVVG